MRRSTLAYVAASHIYFLNSPSLSLLAHHITHTHTHTHSPSAARTTQLKKCILWTNATIAFASRFVAHTHDTPRHNAAVQQP
jgi:hypothetical protein